MAGGNAGGEIEQGDGGSRVEKRDEGDNGRRINRAKCTTGFSDVLWTQDRVAKRHSTVGQMLPSPSSFVLPFFRSPPPFHPLFPPLTSIPPSMPPSQHLSTPSERHSSHDTTLVPPSTPGLFPYGALVQESGFVVQMFFLPMSSLQCRRGSGAMPVGSCP